MKFLYNKKNIQELEEEREEEVLQDMEEEDKTEMLQEVDDTEETDLEVTEVIVLEVTEEGLKKKMKDQKAVLEDMEEVLKIVRVTTKKVSIKNEIVIKRKRIRD